MKKLFWPLLTLVFFIIVMFFWFDASVNERKLSLNLSKIVERNIWLSYDLKGDDVVLRGIAPDENIRKTVVNEVKALSGIDEIVSKITIVESYADFNTTIMISSNSITLSGMIPTDVDRFALINSIEKKKPGMIVYDELEQATGNSPYFQENMSYLIGLLGAVDEGQIILNNNGIMADPETFKTIEKLNDLPSHMILKTINK